MSTDKTLTPPPHDEPVVFTRDQLDWLPWIEPMAEAELTDAPHRRPGRRAARQVAVLPPAGARSRRARGAHRTDKDIFYNPEDGLPRAERELAAAATSRLNGCIYCASVHARFAAIYSKRAEDVDRLLDEGRRCRSRRALERDRRGVGGADRDARSPSDRSMSSACARPASTIRRSSTSIERGLVLQLGQPPDAVARRAREAGESLALPVGERRVPQPTKRMMKLGAFVHETGQHVAAWRHPGAHMHSGASFQEMVETAQLAERGKFDFLFLADTAAVSTSGSADSRSRMGKVVKFEPMTVLSALAAVTKNLGFVATSTTTFNEPYTLARQFASLDQISGGRSGWNLVTSNNEGDALNYSYQEHPAHSARYERAIEFAEVVTGLWDSWEHDAFIRDKESGINFDPAKQHVLNHKGKHFQVKGPLNVACSPQGRPVLVQAGASGTGRDVAARLAEIVFTAQTVFEQGKEFYADVRARVPKFGRSQDEVLVMPGFYPVVAATQSEAQEKYDYLQSLIQVPVGLAVLEHTIGVHDLDKLPLDGPVPEMPDTNGPLSRQRLLLEQAKRDKLTLWELCLRQCRPARPRDVDRHADAGRRRDGALVQGRRRRRLQRHARLAAGIAQGFRRSGHSRAAAPRPVPHGIRGHDLAREPRPADADQPVPQDPPSRSRQ